ncbi:hypothetical protein IQ07DRAFT_525852 [Pyrenochaeta sp. DS3sAY3a]|nr:hypothetical protein IQ07DRAFT_525852 [Pyrenochaeta sp. DS3sAY3a]
MAGFAYKLEGRWDAELEVKVMDTRKKKLGANHPDTLSSRANLVLTYWNQGRWDAVEDVFVQVMDARKKQLGTDYLDIPLSMNNVACT